MVILKMDTEEVPSISGGCAFKGFVAATVKDLAA